MITGNLAGVSNLATWTGELEFVNDTTGAAWFTTLNPPAEVTLKLRDRDSNAIVLSGSLTGGELVVTGDGLITFTFPASSMSGLCAKAYDCGGLYTAAITGEVSQFFLGGINVYQGL